jgi:hypothetical protein
MITRSGKAWTFNFELAKPDMAQVESYIRDILNTSGDDFVDYITPSDPLFNHSRIVLELGDGSIRTIRLGPPDASGQVLAAVSGSDFVYSIPEWSNDRLFVEPDFFESE